MVAIELLVKWPMQTSINSPLKFKVLFSGVELPGGLQIYTYKHVYYIYHIHISCHTSSSNPGKLSSRNKGGLGKGFSNLPTKTTPKHLAPTRSFSSVISFSA